jgi:hypothetical protein
VRRDREELAERAARAPGRTRPRSV